MAEKRKKVDVYSLSQDTVKEIAERYVTDYESYTMADLCNIYKLSKHYFREVLKRAIVECIVSYQVAEAIRDKSITNQHRHFEKGRASAENYYMILFNERFSYFKEHSYDPEKAPVIAKNYLHASLKDMATNLGLSPRENFYYIWKGAVYYFTDLEYSMFIGKLRKDFPNDNQLDVKIQKIDGFRKTYSELKARLEIAEIQLETLDEVISSEDEEIGRREILEDEIDEIKKIILTMRNQPE